MDLEISFLRTVPVDMLYILFVPEQLIVINVINLINPYKMVDDLIIYIVITILVIPSIIGLLLQRKGIYLPKVNILPKTWTEDKKTNYWIIIVFVGTFIVGYLINSYVENYKSKDPEYDIKRGYYNEETY
jgi:hypothetical protein